MAELIIVECDYSIYNQLYDSIAIPESERKELISWYAERFFNVSQGAAIDFDDIVEIEFKGMLGDDNSKQFDCVNVVFENGWECTLKNFVENGINDLFYKYKAWSKDKRGIIGCLEVEGFAASGLPIEECLAYFDKV
jgi:hypothetical protein